MEVPLTVAELIEELETQNEDDTVVFQDRDGVRSEVQDVRYSRSRDAVILLEEAGE